MYGEQKRQFDGPTIIYCPTKKMTSTIQEQLNSVGIRCDIYHADLTIEKRKETQAGFMADEIDV